MELYHHKQLYEVQEFEVLGQETLPWQYIYMLHKQHRTRDP